MSNLPDIVMCERNLMAKAELPGSILRRLPFFFEKLNSSKKTKTVMSNFDAKIMEKEKEAFQNLQDSVDWVEEKITYLNTSIISPHPLIVEQLKKAQESIKFKYCLIPTLPLDVLLEALRRVINVVASHGDISLLKDWVNITDNEWKLIFPPCIDKVYHWRKSDSLRNWKEMRGSDSLTLYSYLKILAQYSTYEPLSLPLKIYPSSLAEAELLCVKGYVGLFLSSFSSENPPYSSDEILSLIDTFLCMIEGEIVNLESQSNKKEKKGRKINDPRQRDREKGVNWMKEEWKKDPQVSQPIMVGRFLGAIRREEIILEVASKRSTFENYAKEADPLPRNERLKRKKSPNIKQGVIGPLNRITRISE